MRGIKMTNRMINELLFVIVLILEIAFPIGVIWITIAIDENTEYKFTMFYLIAICIVGFFLTTISTAHLFKIITKGKDGGIGFEDLAMGKIVIIDPNNLILNITKQDFNELMECLMETYNYYQKYREMAFKSCNYSDDYNYCKRMERIEKIYNFLRDIEYQQKK